MQKSAGSLLPWLTAGGELLKGMVWIQLISTQIAKESWKYHPDKFWLVRQYSRWTEGAGDRYAVYRTALQVSLLLCCSRFQPSFHKNCVVHYLRLSWIISNWTHNRIYFFPPSSSTLQLFQPMSEQNVKAKNGWIFRADPPELTVTSHSLCRETTSGTPLLHLLTLFFCSPLNPR